VNGKIVSGLYRDFPSKTAIVAKITWKILVPTKFIRFAMVESFDLDQKWLEKLQKKKGKEKRKRGKKEKKKKKEGKFFKILTASIRHGSSPRPASAKREGMRRSVRNRSPLSCKHRAPTRDKILL